MTRPIKLLIVEDSEDDARLALLALRRGGFQPSHTRVQDMQSLLDAFRTDWWDAVLSDFSMPGFSGLDALNAFRSTGLDIPFIFVSGTIGEETAVLAMKAGASDYVMKHDLKRLAPALERELAQAAIRAERRQAEVDLRLFEAQLRQAQKMESIGTLAGGIAHDFNNILGTILGNAELLRDSLGERHVGMEHVDEIQRASLRARDLVRQILAFSRQRPQDLRVQPLAPIVKETHQLLRKTLPARVVLEALVSDEPVSASADATQLQQVLMNLCTNAWHALPDSTGRITIGLQPVVLDEAAIAELGASLRTGQHAHLWVSDTGIGMDSATRERIFEPFFTTKPVGQGTGLGLAVVHGIVTAHAGAIHVESQPGTGSHFHIYLPAIQALQPLPQQPVPGVASSRGKGEHVVYIDDDHTMVLVASRLLERAGYRVNAFADAGEALAFIRASPAQVDMVVTDYSMPECSGLDVARELALLRPELPVVISSGYISEELRRQAAAIGVRELLEKESTFQALCPLVTRVLASVAGLDEQRGPTDSHSG